MKRPSGKKKKNNVVILIVLGLVLLRSCFALVWDDLVTPSSVIASGEPTLAPVFLDASTRTIGTTDVPLVSPSDTPPIPTATVIPSVTPSPTPHPLALDNQSSTFPYTGYVSHLVYGKGGKGLQGYTQSIDRQKDGTVSVDLNITGLPGYDEIWLGGHVSGAWPYHFGMRTVRILGECSHPCILYVADDAGTIITQNIWGVIDYVWNSTIDDGWVVFKPIPYDKRLDRITFRIGPFDNPDLVIESIPPRIGDMTAESQGSGKAVVALVKPVGDALYFAPDFTGQLSLMLDRDEYGLSEQDDIEGFYILPVTLASGDHVLTLTCLHVCDISFPDQYGNMLRAPIHVIWSEENQGRYLIDIGIPPDVPQMSGWIVVSQIDWGGPDIGIDVRID